MSYVVLLGAGSELVQRVQSVPGHRVVAIDRDRMDELARINGLEGLLTNSVGELAEAVFFGDAIPIAESLSMAESINTRIPAIDLVIIGEPNTDLILRAMRSGVRDVVPPTVGEDELKVLLHRVSEGTGVRINPFAAAPEVEPSDPHRVIVVSGPKGGVGRSTIASNLAVEFAKVAPMSTVLVDMDLQFGDIDSLLDLEPLHTIDDAFESAAVSDTLILKTFLTVHPAGFYVLCGSTSPTLKDNISAEQVRHLIRQLSKQFAHVVVDTASGIDDISLSVIECATDLVLVSSMDGTSAVALRRELVLLNRLDLVPNSRHIVLNFADRRSGIDVREVEGLIGAPVEVVVPRSLEVLVAANLGQSLVDVRSRSRVAKAIRQLVTRIQADEVLGAQSKHRGIEVA